MFLRTAHQGSVNVFLRTALHGNVNVFLRTAHHGNVNVFLRTAHHGNVNVFLRTAHLPRDYLQARHVIASIRQTADRGTPWTLSSPDLKPIFSPSF